MLGAGGSRGAGWFHTPLDTVAKDRRVPAFHTPENPRHWTEERENPGPGFTSSKALEPTHKDKKLPKIFSSRGSGQMQ